MTLAHAAGGHWLVDLMWVLPVLLVVAWISIRALLDRRAERRESDADRPPP